MEFLSSQDWEMILRLFLAVVLGGLLGVERSLAGKTAGIRTYALVSMGSALFVIVSQLVAASYQSVGWRNFDPLRVASQVVVGIGFLGTGLIIFQSSKLRGLTTAAGLWVAAGIGLALGFGLYPLALAAAVLTLFVFTILWFLQEYLNRRLLRPPSKPPPAS
jgi:putative Mg2+ transporter-C (MgtC) family protein